MNKRTSNKMQKRRDGSRSKKLEFYAWTVIASAVLIGPLSAEGQNPGAPEIRTPKAPIAPRINGPFVFGVRPGHPFLYNIPATGDRPMSFSAEGLPAGLQLKSGQ